MEERKKRQGGVRTNCVEMRNEGRRDEGQGSCSQATRSQAKGKESKKKKNEPNLCPLSLTLLTLFFLRLFLSSQEHHNDEGLDCVTSSLSVGQLFLFSPLFLIS